MIYYLHKIQFELGLHMFSIHRIKYFPKGNTIKLLETFTKTFVLFLNTVRWDMRRIMLKLKRHG